MWANLTLGQHESVLDTQNLDFGDNRSGDNIIFKEEFPSETLIGTIVNNEIADDVKAPLITLFTNLWLDNSGANLE